MSFFKNLFNKKPKAESPSNANEKVEPQKSEGPVADADVPWMTERRLKSLGICKAAGFRPANSLPTDWDRQLRPAAEIAGRLNAIKAIVLWLMIPPENLPNEKILAFVNNNELKKYLSESEVSILSAPRDDEDLRNSIGWKFENAWPLAWYFGFNEPEMTGEMMSGELMQEILTKHSCSLDGNVSEWSANQEKLSEKTIVNKEDLFYCLHNAVRSAQMGGNTVPEGFHPVGNGGVIHERRHSLTWMLSKDTAWEDTDLST